MAVKALQCRVRDVARVLIILAAWGFFFVDMLAMYVIVASGTIMASGLRKQECMRADVSN
ncbi:hypothetical protein PSEUDO8Z_180148 [Pseudomonas sp. 8Z]|nr:hypothetical protein PSEUDO8Z_180148 [Pseudomonas sp. 8Z]